MRGLRDAYGDKTNVSIAPGSYQGIFDVVVDGKIVYSKKETGAFPTLEQVEKLLDGNA